MRAIIFSKDRAMQLDACLRSLALQCVDFAESLDVRVLYQWSSVEHAEAYAEIAALHPGVLVPEVSFEAQVRGLLAGAGEHVLFATDDTIFVRPFKVAEIGVSLAENPWAVGYSMRLGEHLDRCYPTNVAQALPEVRPASTDAMIMTSKWLNANGDWGYPLELSSSIYRTRLVLDWLDGRHFRSPNELEASLATVAQHPTFAHNWPRLLWSPLSLAFSVPCNRVQSTHANRAGTDPAHTADALLVKWRDGWRIDVSALAGYTPRACHEELAFTFERRPGADHR